MNPRNKWNPVGEVVNPFEDTEIYPSDVIIGGDSYPRHPSGEIHYPRYTLQPSRSIINTRDIMDPTENEAALLQRSVFRNQTPNGAARTYRKVQPPNQDALAYHREMYPPTYTDMWGYHSTFDETDY